MAQILQDCGIDYGVAGNFSSQVEVTATIQLYPSRQNHNDLLS